MYGDTAMELQNLYMHPYITSQIRVAGGEVSCRGARGTVSGGQCEGAPCLSLFHKEVGWLRTRAVAGKERTSLWQQPDQRKYVLHICQPESLPSGRSFR